MTGFEAAVELLAKRAGGRLAFDPVFQPLVAPVSVQSAPGGPPPNGCPTPCIAVDGSHAVLVDNGSVWVVAHRAAAVGWPGPRPIDPGPVITAVLAADRQDNVDAGYAAVGAQPPSVRNADSFGSALSALAEFGAARAAIRSAAPDTLVLLDGAMTGLPPHAQGLADNLRAEAATHRVTLVAVSKRSSLTDGAPLVASLQKMGPDGTWFVEVPGHIGVFVARLHARSRHAFRIDADSAGVLRDLVPLARDAVYLGYPYPLARVHNVVALTGARVAELKGRLDAALRKAGPGTVQMAEDFHAVLDRSVPG